MIIIKILIVHNFYKQSGGEDKVVNEEMKLLSNHGINVSTYFVNNDDIKIKGISNKISLGINTVWSKEQLQLLKTTLKVEKPDIVHFHNTFPLISPSAYYACKQLNIPVVQTIHNYRLACPGALLMRQNEICEKCVSGSLLNSVKYGCYRDSKLQTLPLTTMLYTHRILNTWNRKVDKFIALTEFSKEKIAQTGIEKGKIVVKPNFIDKKLDFNVEKENYIVFVGRLSREKGTHVLLEAWKKMDGNMNTRLLIIGDGPEQQNLLKQYEQLKNVEFLGKLDNYKILDIVSRAKYLIIPSLWYEGFPMTIVEAYSVSTPVISSNIGSLKEIVKNEFTGFHFENNNIDDLGKVLLKALKYPRYNQLVNNVDKLFEEKYTSEKNYLLLMSIYNQVLKEKNND